jgi:hypothetical protein
MHHMQRKCWNENGAHSFSAIYNDKMVAYLVFAPCDMGFLVAYMIGRTIRSNTEKYHGRLRVTCSIVIQEPYYILACIKKQVICTSVSTRPGCTAFEVIAIERAFSHRWSSIVNTTLASLDCNKIHIGGRGLASLCVPACTL